MTAPNEPTEQPLGGDPDLRPITPAVTQPAAPKQGEDPDDDDSDDGSASKPKRR